MGKALELENKKFGKLFVLHKNTQIKNKQIYWDCICECGNKTTVCGSKLINGHTKSCGCLAKVGAKPTHNKTNTRIYRIWCAMKSRCLNSKTQAYKYYGAKGIKIHDDWLNDFQKFYDWSIINGYKDDLTIDRIDVNGNYEPNNCRWVTAKEQSRNTTKTIYIKYKNEEKPLVEWSEILGINYNTLRSRILEMNWSIERAFKNDKN